MGKRFSAFAEIYTRDVQRYVRDVAAGLRAGSLEAVIQPAHMLKSSSRILGASRASYWAERLEARTKAMQKGPVDLKELAILARAMSQALSEVLQEINRRVRVAEKAS